LALQVIFSGASLVLCSFFFVYFHLYIKRRTGREGILASCREEVNRLIAEIDRATDRDAQLVEERIASLRKVLEEADRRIALLSRDMDRHRTGKELYTALEKAAAVPPAAPVGGAASSAGLPPAVPGPAESSPPPVPGALTGAAASSAPVQGSPAKDSIPPPVRPLTERAAELSRQGISPELIASRLGVSLSEVELALAVSRRRGA
jgi:hypothetical protein